HWFDRAAKSSNAQAQYNLGQCYELGNGIDKDETKAFACYKRSAENGDVNARFQLGYCYVNGIGTEINEEKGFELYNEAAGNKHSNIRYNFVNYDEEIDNLDEIGKINYWYYKAAENDNKFALYKLGEHYELGKGVGYNERRAIEFYKKSADQGLIDALCRLGHIYNNGIQIDINEIG